MRIHLDKNGGKTEFHYRLYKENTINGIDIGGHIQDPFTCIMESK